MARPRLLHSSQRTTTPITKFPSSRVRLYNPAGRHRPHFLDLGYLLVYLYSQAILDVLAEIITCKIKFLETCTPMGYPRTICARICIYLFLYLVVDTTHLIHITYIHTALGITLNPYRFVCVRIYLPQVFNRYSALSLKPYTYSLRK